MPKFSRKRSHSAKGRKRKRTFKTRSHKGFKRKRTSTKAKYGYRLTSKAGTKFARRRKNAVPANKSHPDETTTWLGGELIIIATDIASDATDYTDWSLNNPLDWAGGGGANPVPGWTENTQFFNFYRPLGSSTSVHIWQLQGPTASVDHFAGFEAALVPMDAASTPVASGTAYVDGVINTGTSVFWRNTWPHTTGRILSGSDFNTNAGHATLKGSFTTWSALTGQFDKAERYDPVFLTARASALSTGKKCSWNLVITTINPTAMEEFSYQAVVKVRHKIEFSVKNTVQYTFDEAECNYLKALKQSEAYRIIRHRNGKIPKGQPGWLVDKPQYIGICDSLDEKKGDSKSKDDMDMDFETLSLTPLAKPSQTPPPKRPLPGPAGGATGGIKVLAVNAKLLK